nr:hypothetical protein [Aliibacillus thermotolerans]
MDVTDKKMIMNRKELAFEKVEKIKTGYSAFAESDEVIQLIRKELDKQNIEVYEDKTELGSWFIPTNKKE